MDYTVSIRFNLGRLLSWAHFVMCAPRFTELVKHGWYSAGILTEHPGAFDSPVDYTLHEFDPTADCAIKKCHARLFAHCPYCDAVLRFKHSMEKMHQCDGCANQ